MEQGGFPLGEIQMSWMLYSVAVVAESRTHHRGGQGRNDSQVGGAAGERQVMDWSWGKSLDSGCVSEAGPA